MKQLFFIFSLLFILSCSKDADVAVTPDHKCQHLIGKWCSDNASFGCYIFKADNTYEYTYSGKIIEQGPWETKDCIYLKLKFTLGFSGSETLHVRSHSALALDMQTDKYSPPAYRPYYKR